MAHTHFTRDDRIFLAKLIREGLSVRSIARILGFHPSSVYRELARGRVSRRGRTGIGYSVREARRENQRATAQSQPATLQTRSG